ncbi:hypothetical protein OE88DRAFT_1160929 [Heliocybe sulcata]|uniref:Uncharacterized protein n=1 Tax=Heliocybe sulcata TaxID=5364 RepID=A0A5C3NAX8_9AGAM|nr:hypothetical protein OE88DRAFT_1160929 [Heliocybe sulcata]
MGAPGGAEEDKQVKEVQQLVQARRDKEAEVRKARQAETADLVLRRSKLTRRDPRTVGERRRVCASRGPGTPGSAVIYDMWWCCLLPRLICAMGYGLVIALIHQK